MALTNCVRLIGHCGTDPVVQRYGGQKTMLRLPIYTEHWSLPDESGHRQNFKELHWCVFFGANAERAGHLLMKGSQVHLSGAIHYHKVEKQGRSEIRPQIIVEEFTLSSKAMMTKEVYELIFKGK